MKFPLERTHRLHELRRSHCGEQVILMGWVNRVRDLGKLVFIDLRDRWGLTQLSFTAEMLTTPLDEVMEVRDEWVLAVRGEVSVSMDSCTSGVHMHRCRMAWVLRPSCRAFWKQRTPANWWPNRVTS